MTPSGGPLFLVSELEELRELSEEVCAKRNDELEVEVLDRLGEIDEASEMVELFSLVTSSFSSMGAVLDGTSCGCEREEGWSAI